MLITKRKANNNNNKTITFNYLYALSIIGYY
jgi:hypothetical protein